jgi:ribosomal protein S27AE
VAVYADLTLADVQVQDIRKCVQVRKETQCLNFVGRGIHMSEIDRLKFIAECPAVKETLCPRCLGDKFLSLHKKEIVEALFCEGCGYKFWVRRVLPIGPGK